MNKKRILALLISAVMMFTYCAAAFSVQAGADVQPLTITVGSVNGAPGEEVVVPITISNNTGNTETDFLVNIAFSITYDQTKLELTKVTNTKVLPGGLFTKVYRSPYMMTWNDIDEGLIANDEVIANMTFKIADDAAGSFDINIAFEERGVLNSKDEDVPANAVAGKVESVCNTHSYGEYTYDDNATCTEAGTRTRVCKACGAKDTVEDPDHPAKGHSFTNYETDKPAGCITGGTETASCDNGCGETDTRDTESLGHDFGDFEVETAPTCTEKGKKVSKCSRCDATQTEEIPATGHSFGEYEVKTPATCTEKGEKVSKCANCDATQSEEIPATGHTFGEYTVKSPATCEEDEVRSGKCTNCEEEAIQVMEGTKLGHDWVKDAEKSVVPTCTEKGKDVYVCKNDPTHTDEKEVDAIGHDWVKDEEKSIASTCTEKGKDVYVCKNDPTHTDEKKVAELGHDWIIDEENSKAETCTEDGVAAYKCSRCEETKTEVVPAAHKFGEWTVETHATTTQTGKEIRVCEVCGEKEERVIPMLKPDVTTSYRPVIPPVIVTTTSVVTTTTVSDDDAPEDDSNADTDTDTTKPADDVESVTYEVIEGDGAVITINMGDKLTIRIDADYEKFVSVYVDGKKVNKKNYTVKSGSTIVTLKNSFLETLSEGEHKMVVKFTDGEAVASFEINGDDNNDNVSDDSYEVDEIITGDDANPGTGFDASLVMMISFGAAVIGAGAFAIGNKKRK